MPQKARFFDFFLIRGWRSAKDIRVDKIKAALVGCGGVAGYGHIPALDRNSHFELVGLADIDEPKVRRLAEQCRCRPYTDLETMLDTEKPEMLTISTAEGFHPSMLKAAAERDIHVFCEKPLAPTAAEARKMVELMESKGLQLHVDFILRYSSYATRIMEEVHKRDLGTLELIRCNGLWDFHGCYKDPERRLRNLEYGTLACGIHDVDLISYLSGQSISKLYCVGHFPEADQYTPPGTVLLGGTLSDGAIWSADASGAVGRACKHRVVHYHYDLYFDRGHVSWHRDNGAPGYFKVIDDEGIHCEDFTGHEKDFDATYDDLATRLREGPDAQVALATGRDALAAQVICDRANQIALAGSSLSPIEV